MKIMNIRANKRGDRKDSYVGTPETALGDSDMSVITAPSHIGQ